MLEVLHQPALSDCLEAVDSVKWLNMVCQFLSGCEYSKLQILQYDMYKDNNVNLLERQSDLKKHGNMLKALIDICLINKLINIKFVAKSFTPKHCCKN
jgi:hypothetical protein